MWQQDFLILAFASTLTLILLLMLGRAWTRLHLSRAKHPSLRGHSKWSRRIGRLIPYFEYDSARFFDCDAAPAAIRQLRERGFRELASELNAASPLSIEFSKSLDDSISDQRFTNNYRVPFPFRKQVSSHLRLSNVADETRGMQVRDLDGNWLYDLSGSYGVNVFGYDFYKECMTRGLEKVGRLGPVLGPYHPLIRENVERLKQISGLDEVSFHMSGTEAVMQAVRLARYHTGKSQLVRFCGAYHGWWDGVQPGIGNQRSSDDVYTLRDMSPITLRVLRTRNDIACVLVNPLQALHPNADASSDASLIASDRSACFDRNAYSAWLKQLREVCSRRGIVLIIDDVFTGFRLAYGGAQQYFDVQADIVTYGKSLGGGLPVGVVCGRHDLMKRFKDDQPVNISFARGTFNSHPLVMATMNEFLHRLDLPWCQKLYFHNDRVWDERVAMLNQRLEDQDLPVRIANLTSIWTILYTQPGRYNWMFQFYLRKHGLLLSWVGSGRVIMSLNCGDDDFEAIMQRFVSAAQDMKANGWWWLNPESSNRSIKRQVLLEMLRTRLGLGLGLGREQGAQDTNRSEPLSEAGNP
jgi:glutamate-1-semialdehyde 2,1-aminomutase